MNREHNVVCILAISSTASLFGIELKMSYGIENPIQSRQQAKKTRE